MGMKNSRDDEHAVYCDICGEGGEGFGSYCIETFINPDEWVTHCCTCKPDNGGQQ